MALSLGANGIATCGCGNTAFYNLCKVDEDSQVLVATHCTQCHTEAPVPLDPPKKEDKFKMFDAKVPDSRDFN